MVDPWMETLATQQHGLITRRQALERGLSPKAIKHQLRRRSWQPVARGVYKLTGAPETPRMRAMAAVLLLGAGAVASHRTAACLLGIPGFAIEPLTVSIPRARRRYPGIQVEQSLALPTHHRCVIDRIPCTSVARTMFDLCGDRGVRSGRSARALDHALASKLVTMPELWRVLDDLAEHGRRGTVWMRTLLMERRGSYAPPESELEARFVALVHRYRLGRPERQVDLGDSDRWIGRVDFAWREERLVVEVDGARHHNSFLDRRADEERDTALTAAGWTVLRFTWSEVVETPGEVADTIRGVLWPSEGPKHAPKRAS
jgi:very-short-patch-repair endonuclease